jgi:hypothetical protein
VTLLPGYRRLAEEERARQAAVHLMGYAARVVQESEQSVGLELLSDIRTIFESKNNPDVMPSKDIINGLVAMEDRPWATFVKGEKPVNAHRLSRLLKGFDVQPAGDVRIGSKVLKAYRLVAFSEAFSRYLPSEPQHRHKQNKDGPKPTKTKSLHDPAVADSKTALSPDKHWVCCDVALSTPDPGAGEENDDDEFVVYGGA